jgi:hypothetical protein
VGGGEGVCAVHGRNARGEQTFVQGANTCLQCNVAEHAAVSATGGAQVLNGARGGRTSGVVGNLG